MVKYLLPELSYAYDALEPHISARTLELHHDRHHRAHVDGANETTERLEHARRDGNFAHINALEHHLAFHVSGHLLHSIFWQNLDPHGGGRPTGELEKHINRDFGTFDSFKVQLNRVAGAVLGAGWAALVFDPMSRRLTTALLHDHQSEALQASVPLLVIDVWEHAYYPQYENNRMHFVDALWHLWNWSDVAERYDLAQRLDLGLEDVTEESIVLVGDVQQAGAGSGFGH